MPLRASDKLGCDLRSECSERGAVVVLVALLMMAFFGLTALAVDLTIYASSIQQARNTAQLGALSALERYFATSGSASAKLTAALDRANEVTGLNMGISQGSANTYSTAQSSQTAPLLEPGRYYFSNRDDGSNPCSAGDVAPCFVRNASGTDPVNAFRISGEIFPRANLRFARAFFRSGTLSESVKAIATIVPRHGCFVVDISGSMTRESHHKESYFRNAYLLTADNGGAPLTSNNNNSWSAFNSSGYQNRPMGGSGDPLDHFVGDYESRTVRGDLDYSAADFDHHPTPTENGGLYAIGSGKSFRVETYRGSDYTGPEPLNTVFRGIDRALELFQQRQVVGDMACIVFYDQSLQWSRIFSLTSDIDYLRKFTNPDILHDNEHGLELMIKHGLFPQAGSMTNTTLGLTEAMHQLTSQQSDGTPSSDFMVLIGDGQTNCMNCALSDQRYDYNHNGEMDMDDYRAAMACFYPSYCDYSWWNETPVCPATPGQCSWADSNGNGAVEGDLEDQSKFYQTWQNWGYCPTGGSCSNTLENYYYSMQEVKQFVSNTIVAARIPIHVMLIGSDSGPNTIDVEDPSNPGSCLSENEKRQKRNEPGQRDQFPSVVGEPSYYCYQNPTRSPCWNSNRSNEAVCCYWSEYGASPLSPKDEFDQKSSSNPFLSPNKDLYDIATMTGGLWAPIRPSSAGCEPRACDITGLPRFEDPLCRTPQQQVEAAMEEIMGQNPFTLVVTKADY